MIRTTINYLVIGSCCGILLGLSLSPVIEKSLGILLTFITSLLGFACGISVLNSAGNEKFKINPQPLSFTMIGIVIGSFMGIFMRNHNTLGTDHIVIVSDSSVHAKLVETQGNVTALHADFEKVCPILQPLHGNSLRNELENMGDSKIRQALKISDDSVSLELIKAMTCDQN